ncbi:hypothetical protein PENSUB_8057 [Penicillium subrubescens]|uniref:Uncharacterized protein n=1 Tax=Penicillium subrubescens TaxID=1316194 RepID=A0A1Q5THY9_9EURO|nr:hypothetical protein PENSUB_8057 [Penicillium subrubescens]
MDLFHFALGVLIQGDMAHHVFLMFGGTAFVFGLHVGQDYGGADVQPDLVDTAGTCSKLIQDYLKCSDSEVEPCRICDDIRLILADGPILELQTEWDAPQYTRGCKNTPCKDGHSVAHTDKLIELGSNNLPLEAFGVSQLAQK